MSPRSEAGDPIAAYSPAMARFFAGVMRRQIARSFRAFRLAHPGLPEIDPARPLIVYSNHPSWWDPVLYIALAERFFPSRRPFGPIDAAALERYRFMRRIGLFGVEPDTRAGAARFLRVADAVLASPARMLWVTAQGDFADPRDRPVALRPGIAHALARNPDAVALPLAMEYPFWTEKRPEALAAWGTPLDGREGGTARDWTPRLEDGLTAAMDRLADASRARDPAAFERLQAGRAGVGGVYGAFGRARAALVGRRYAAEHVEDRT